MAGVTVVSALGKVASAEDRATRRLRLIEESEEDGWYPAPP